MSLDWWIWFLFGFMSGACIFGFLAHVFTGFLYERLIRDEYQKIDDIPMEEVFEPIEELMRK